METREAGVDRVWFQYHEREKNRNCPETLLKALTPTPPLPMEEDLKHGKKSGMFRFENSVDHVETSVQYYSGRKCKDPSWEKHAEQTFLTFR